jgi:hypothetical protein
MKEQPRDPCIPLWVRIMWKTYVLVTWPRQVRQLKREGFRRTGWRTWEWEMQDGSGQGSNSSGPRQY